MSEYRVEEAVRSILKLPDEAGEGLDGVHAELFRLVKEAEEGTPLKEAPSP